MAICNQSTTYLNRLLQLGSWLFWPAENHSWLPCTERLCHLWNPLDLTYLKLDWQCRTVGPLMLSCPVPTSPSIKRSSLQRLIPHPPCPYKKAGCGLLKFDIKQKNGSGCTWQLAIKLHQPLRKTGHTLRYRRYYASSKAYQDWLTLSFYRITPLLGPWSSVLDRLSLYSI